MSLKDEMRQSVEHDETERLAAPGAIAGTAAVRCDVAAPAPTGAKLLKTFLKM